MVVGIGQGDEGAVGEALHIAPPDLGDEAAGGVAEGLGVVEGLGLGAPGAVFEAFEEDLAEGGRHLGEGVELEGGAVALAFGDGGRETEATGVAATVAVRSHWPEGRARP